MPQNVFEPELDNQMSPESSEAIHTVTHVIVRPTPRVFHRYKSEEMSGPLPAVLFKALPEVYARRLVDVGEMMWSTLSWFQNEEDPHRGDNLDATRRHFPPDGLAVTRIQRAGRPDHATFTLARHGNQWRPIQSRHIFIYSTTLDPSFVLRDPAAQTCVEIFEPAEVVRRVRRALERHRTARPETLIYDEVRYWSSDKPPEEVCALPHKLTMLKREEHSWQQEYRFAFGTRADVYDFENVDCRVLSDEVEQPRHDLEPHRHRMKIRLGSLKDCCRVR
jgi:hypothetical protein